MRTTLTRPIRATLKLAPAFVLVLGFAPEAAAYNCPQSPSPSKTETYQGFLGRVHQLDGQELPYRLFVPPNYDPNQAYPLVLYLHHAGLAGTDQNNDSGWDNCVHLTSEIGSGDDYGGVFTHRAVDEDGNRFDTQQRYPHFVLAPHANSPQYGFGGGVAGSATATEHPTRRLVWAILEQVRTEFKIDPRRLYVTGISMGCYGTWDIIMRTPGVFAAASPQSCRGDPNQTLLSELKDMPIWSMCGTNDSYFSGAQAMADGMEAVGATAFTFTAMQGVGHSINDRGYDYPGFIDWMFAQRLPGMDPPGSGGMSGAGNAGASGAGAGSAGSAGAGVAGVGGNGGSAGASSQDGGTGGVGGNAGVSAQGGTAGTESKGGGAGASPQGGGGSTAAGGSGAGGGATPATGGAGSGGVAGMGGSTGGTSLPLVPGSSTEDSGCSITTARRAPSSLASFLAIILGAFVRRRTRQHPDLRARVPSGARDWRRRVQGQPRRERLG